MSPRRKRPTLEELLDQLSALRDDPDSPATLEQLRQALTGRQNLLAARAARVAADLGKSELVEVMLEAFDRFMTDPVETDKGCHAKTEIAKALVTMEHPASGLFLRGMRHKQMEGAYGGPVDVAVELRANCALGLVNSGHPDSVLELVPLLVDEGLPVRLAAAQAVAASGQMAAEAVLRFKVVAGDAVPEGSTECLSGLLRLAPERSIAFVKPLLRKISPPPTGVREAAILALGESRLEEAVPVLVEEWKRSYDAEGRRMVLLALVTSRREPALEFLLSLVADAGAREAREAITALAIHRYDEKVRERVEAAWGRNEDRAQLEAHFRREFDESSGRPGSLLRP